MPAPHIENTILVNIGDCMEMWTRGYLMASPHRVVNQDSVEKKSLSRFSTAFFFEPDMSCELKAFKKYEDLAYEAKYSSKTYGEHIHNKYIETYQNYKK